jgi:sugar/nucleoside kinase (ribokinase family)
MVERLPRPRRAPSILVLGDLMLDVVLAPERPLERATDVPGVVRLRTGGSAAGTARWLGRLGARVQLVTSIGRDSIGRALVDVVRRDGVQVRAVRPHGQKTGRIGILIGADGERSFVADRSAADALDPSALQPAWFARLDAVHLPVYSLLTEPLGLAGRRAVELARSAGASVTLDLASSGPLLANGRATAERLLREVHPDLLFATEGEALALLGERALESLLEFAPVAIVKRGAAGATVLARRVEGDATEALRFEVATQPIGATDSTGAGDAFDAGFLVAWLDARADAADAASGAQAGAGAAQFHGAGGREALVTSAVLRRATLAGHRTAARHLGRPPEELLLLG